MPIHYVGGDATRPIITDGLRVIVHVCNNRGGWGAGFTKAISQRWKEPETAYRAMVNRFGSDDIFRHIQTVRVEPNIEVVNMIAQDGYKSAQNPTPLKYDALLTCLDRVSGHLWLGVDETKITIHMPRVGCGLAGGKWDKVEEIINMTIAEDFSVYVYTLR